MSELHAIIFDLDDTLYPEREFVFSGFRAVAAWAEDHLDIPGTDGYAGLVNMFNQKVRGDTFNRWLAAHGFAADHLARHLVQVYREHAPTIAPFPEVPMVLSHLRERYELGLVSDGYLAVQQRKLAALGLFTCFDAVVWSDEGGPDAWKPSLWPFKTVLERLGDIAPAEAVYVADNPGKDFLGARHLGLSTIRLRWPGGIYYAHEPPTPAHASDLIIDSLNFLEEALNTLESLDT